MIPAVHVVPVGVLVVSNSRLWRDGLCGLIRHSKGPLRVLGKGEFRHFSKLLIRNPDISVLDAGHCVEPATVRRTLADSERRAVVVGMRQDTEEVLDWLAAGALGYVSWMDTPENLIAMVIGAARDQPNWRPEVAAGLLRRVQKAEKRRAERPHTLTAREREIEDLLLSCSDNKTIADRLHIGVSTVKNHLHEIYRKRHVHSRLEVIQAMTKVGDANEEDLD